MELVRGAALRSFVGDASAPIGRRIRWLVDVARALGAAHRRGVVHRDVKPDNVMIRDDGAVKVLDFGIARRQDGLVDPSAPTEAGASLGTLTERGAIVGTPRYAAPEQLRAEPLDGRTDEFSWGVMAYELLSGSLPWGDDDSTLTLLSKVLSADPPPLGERAPDLPPAVVSAVTRALAKRPDDRFATIDEAADALEPFADMPIALSKTSSGETPRHRGEDAGAGDDDRARGRAARAAWPSGSSRSSAVSWSPGCLSARIKGTLKVESRGPRGRRRGPGRRRRDRLRGRGADRRGRLAGARARDRARGLLPARDRSRRRLGGGDRRREAVGDGGALAARDDGRACRSPAGAWSARGRRRSTPSPRRPPPSRRSSRRRR